VLMEDGESTPDSREGKKIQAMERGRKVEGQNRGVKRGSIFEEGELTKQHNDSAAGT